MLGPATPPLELIASTPKGELKNPYNADIAAIAEEGHHRYLSAGCNGCHGGGGGGGMCPPLTNDTWVYGSDDDTLFRLIALGSDGLTKAGYARVKHEIVTGPMPPFGGIIKTSDDLWRIIAFIRSVNPSSLKPVATPSGIAVLNWVNGISSELSNQGTRSQFEQKFAPLTGDRPTPIVPKRGVLIMAIIPTC
jgi:mono/diheme cytochrome c family protein